jgi:shikimate kinase
MKSNLKHNIILIGFMGCGKTSVGERLAQKLSYRFWDTDRMIEQKERDTINHIFVLHGEEYFRGKETGLLQELLPELDHVVLSTGGGLPLREKNSKLLKEMGFVVYLKASAETTLKRLAGDRTRPLLQGEDREKRIESLLNSRTPIYEIAAHKIIITDHKSIDEISTTIMEAYMKLIY